MSMRQPIQSRSLLHLKALGNFAAALGKLDHDLFVQPRVHFRQPVNAGAGPSATTSSSARPSQGSAAGKPISQIDVQSILEKLAANQGEKLDWKVSIVDLLKLLKLDSSLGTRKQLAQELGYPGALKRRRHEESQKWQT
jgi:Domain of unknown function (DUF3597)